ncbi:hypothetical protein L9F63_022718, partial [Diploptera punctata]
MVNLLHSVLSKFLLLYIQSTTGNNAAIIPSPGDLIKLNSNNKYSAAGSGDISTDISIIEYTSITSELPASQDTELPFLVPEEMTKTIYTASQATFEVIEEIEILGTAPDQLSTVTTDTPSTLSKINFSKVLNGIYPESTYSKIHSLLNTDIQTSTTSSRQSSIIIKASETTNTALRKILILDNIESSDNTLGKNSSVFNDIEISTIMSAKTLPVINEIELSMKTYAVTVHKNKESPTSTSERVFTVIDDSESYVTSSQQSDILSLEETSNYSIESTHPTILIDEYRSTTDRTECEALTTVSIVKKYQDIISARNDLDYLFNQTMTLCHSFAETKNHSIGESTMDQTKRYLNVSKWFIEAVELQSQIVLCQNNTKFEKYKVDGMNEYKVKLEIVEIISEELSKMMENDTKAPNASDQRTSERMMELFEELFTIIKLNKRINILEYNGRTQLLKYKESSKIRYLADLIKIVVEIISTQKEILRIIKNSENMKYMYGEKYMSKLHMTKSLVNISRIEGQLNGMQKFLQEGVEQHELEEKMIFLDHVIRPIVLGIIFIVGIIGNIVLLLVFINYKDMRTAPNAMIINLNISDILCLFVNILFYLLETTVTDWTLGTIVCKLYRFGRYLTLGLSIYSLVFISIQRFLALTDYLSFEFKCRFFGKFQSTLNVIFIWILASAIASPRAIKAHVPYQVCMSGTTEDKDFYKALSYVDFALFCGFPLLIISVTSGLTSARLKSSVKYMPGETIGLEEVKKARV